MAQPVAKRRQLDEGDKALPQHVAKRQRPDEDVEPQQSSSRHDHNTAQGNSRNHYGNVINTYHVGTRQHPEARNPEVSSLVQEVDNAQGLMDALQFEQMDDRFATISAAHAKTCRWLFARDEYKAWRDPAALHTHHGFFWIKGKPGAGKSTLMKCAQRHEEKEHGDLVISFFFNARGDELQRSAEGMYRSLLHQLLEKRPHLLASLPKRKGHLGRSGWPLELLKDMFRAAVLALGSISLTCYVDALDECNDSEARDMVELFESLGESAVEAGLCFRVLLSSRHYPHITIETCQELILEGQEGHKADIADYIRARLKIGKTTLAGEIQTDIQARASGVFLWVVLVVRILNELNARGQIHLLKKRLQTIPDGLHKIFEEILAISGHDDITLLLIFQWLLFSRRPLRREEMYFAVVTDSSDDNIGNWDRREISVHVMERFLLDASRGLAEMTRGKQPAVQFIHESVRDYLLESGLQKLESRLCANVPELSHARLSKCCQHYLEKSAAALLPSEVHGEKEQMSEDKSASKLLGKRARTTHPFIGYALSGIIQHAELAHSPTTPQNAFVASFPHQLWRRLYNLTRQFHTRRLGITTSPIYTFILMSATSLVEIGIEGHTLRRSETIIQNEFHRSLLGIPVDNGDHRLVDLLLKHGADPNSISNSKMHSCLTHAIQRNDRLMVQRLIDAGATVAGGGRDLLECTAGSNADVLSVLLEHPTYATGWHEDCARILRSGLGSAPAIKEKFLKKLDALLFDPISLGNPRDLEPGYQRALHSACRHGNLELVMFLLAQLFGDDSSDGESTRRHYKQEPGNTGFEQEDRLVATLGISVVEAVKSGHLEITRVLLSRGANVNSTGYDGYTALCVAAARGDTVLAELLLTKGARVNTRDYYDCTPLHHATLKQHESVVELFLRYGALADVRDQGGITPLHSTAANGNERILRLLLDHGTDPNIEHSRVSESVLHHASRDGHEQAAPVSLRHRAVEVNALDKFGESALSGAALCGNMSIVQKLLIAGDPVPLSQLNLAVKNAKLYGYDAIVQILIEHGATLP